MEEKKQKLIKFLLLTLVFGLVVFSLVYFFTKMNMQKDSLKFSSDAKFNHLIAGVPYHTLYNNYGSRWFMPSHISVIREVFDFWGYGDGQETIRDAENNLGTENVQINSLVYFLKSKNFETILFNPRDDDSIAKYPEIDFIKSYVAKDIPVIITQQYMDDADVKVGTFRLVIGVFDDSQKITMHDYAFGNNYEMSYDIFHKLFGNSGGGNGLALAIWPTETIAGDLHPKKLTNYPSRDEDAMEKVGKLWSFYKKHYANKNNLENQKVRTSDLESMVAQGDFELLPPLYRIEIYDQLIENLLIANNPQKAIEIITEKFLPINHDLDADFGIFTGQKIGNYRKSVGVYLLLGRAYAMNGQNDLAEKAFRESLAARADYKKTLEEMKVSDELEKGILESMQTVGIL